MAQPDAGPGRSEAIRTDPPDFSAAAPDLSAVAGVSRIPPRRGHLFWRCAPPSSFVLSLLLFLLAWCEIRVVQVAARGVGGHDLAGDHQRAVGGPEQDDDLNQLVHVDEVGHGRTLGMYSGLGLADGAATGDKDLLLILWLAILAIGIACAFALRADWLRRVLVVLCGAAGTALLFTWLSAGRLQRAWELDKQIWSDSLYRLEVRYTPWFWATVGLTAAGALLALLESIVRPERRTNAAAP
jgi:hypothetical protein